MFIEHPQFGSVNGGFPKGYGPWIQAAVILMHEMKALLCDLVAKHATRCNMEGQCFFMTNNGYFGRAPVDDVDRDHVVAILGGAFIPYVLEKRQGHYALVSHAYVEGIMDLVAWEHTVRIDLIAE
jgi:hypothetical protein